MSTSDILRPIGEVSLAGQKYDIARNGTHCHLVRTDQQDAYGRPMAVREALCDHTDPLKVQALLDLVGDLLIQLQGQRDLRRAEHGVEA